MTQPSFLPGVSRSTLIHGVVIYLLIAAFLGLLEGLLAFDGGTFAGIGSPMTAKAELAVARGLVIVIGVMIAPVQLAAAVGLFQRRSWARMLTVIIAGASAVVSILSFLTGGGTTQFIWVALGAFVAYFFYTDYEINRQLSK